jgi:hypothetical protein
MWEFQGSDDASRFLVITAATDAEAERRLLTEHEARLIVYGELSSEDGSKRVGSALALEAASRDEVEALLPDSLGRVEIHPWSFGGRR